MNAKIVSFRKKTCNKIEVSGFKHSLAPILCATLMLNNESTFENVPDIMETRIYCKILKTLGKKFVANTHSLFIYPSDIISTDLSESLTKEIHGSIYLLPVLLQKNKKLRIFQSGGCKIGSSDTYSTRPIHHVIRVLKEFGASFQNGHLNLSSGYKPTQIDILDYSQDKSVLCGEYVSGATKTAILCAAGCEGESCILNPYLKADVLELIEYLKKSGCIVNLTGKILTVIGAKKKNPVRFSFCPDLIEIVTFIAFALYHDVAITFENIPSEKIMRYLSAEFDVLKEMNVIFETTTNSITIPPRQTIRATKIIVTGQSIYSDSQPFFALILSKVNSGISIIEERVWSNRMDYALELKNGGLNLLVEGNLLKILPEKIMQKSEILHARDLRSAAVLTIFALNKKGTVIENIEHLQRGYENFWQKIERLGGNVQFFD